MTAWTSVALEFEFTPGVWTDVTSHICYEAAPVVIRQGSPTEFDDPGPAVLTFALANDTGEWMPGNISSPRYPAWAKGMRVRWKATKGGTTYTRIVGWVTAIAASFPSSSTVQSVVHVTAIDALGLLAQRKLRSNHTERALYAARAGSLAIDVFEARPDTSPTVATMTQYSPDVAAGTTSTTWGTGPNLTFGSDADSSFGGIVSCQESGSNDTIANLRAGHKAVWFHVKTPSSQLAAGKVGVITTLHNAVNGGSPILHFAFSPNVSGGNDLVIRNAANTATMATIGPVPAGQWVKVRVVGIAPGFTTANAGFARQDGTGGFGTNITLTVGSVRAIEFPAGVGTGDCTSASWGGVGGIASETELPDDSHSFVGASAGSVSNRVSTLAAVVSQLPVIFVQLGDLTLGASTGQWSDRSALEVLQEMLRTTSGLALARSRDSVVYAVGADQLWPASPVATIDTDADCIGPPSLVDGAEARPTRVDVEWPGGTAVAIDTAAEASGQIRSRRVTTIARSNSDAKAVGTDILARASKGLRFSQVTIDLLAGKTDHTAALFSEGTSLGGLFPTQRVRLTVPYSHFGGVFVDAYVTGWVEEYAPDRSTVTLDTIPAGAAFGTPVSAYGSGAYGSDNYGG